MRALVQGLDADRMWDRYLSIEGESSDARVVRSTIYWIRAQLDAAAMRAGKPGTARLLRLHIQRMADASAPPRQSLQEFAEEKGIEDFSEAEIVAAWTQAHPEESRKEEGVARLIRKQLAALAELERLIAQRPQIGDELASWLPPRIHNRLREHGIMTIYGLHQFIDQHGSTWWKRIPGMGITKATRILQWLDTHEESIGVRVKPHSRHGFRDQIRKNLMAAQSAAASAAASTIPQLIPQPLEVPALEVSAEPGSSSSVSLVVPMEQLAARLPVELDGSRGEFRNLSSPNVLGASNDMQAVDSWLASYTKHTLRAYRKEAERLMLWAIAERKKPLSGLNREDILAYRTFLADPQPREKWCAARSRIRHTSGWRPFEGPLSDTAINYAMRVTGNLFEFLLSQGYLSVNPAKGMRLAGPTQLREQFGRRMLTMEQWGAIRQQVPEDKASGKRLGLMLDILYGCGLRISELVAARFEHLTSMPDSEDNTGWMLSVLGKRSKVRYVPIATDLVERAFDLARSLGVDTEKGFLIPKVAGRLGAALEDPNQGIDPVTAAQHISTHMQRVADTLRQAGKNRDAQRVEKASAHWMRHTHASHLLQAGAPLAVVQGNLGHASLSTTSVYVSTEERQRMTEVRKAMSKLADQQKLAKTTT